jgi:curved DNA-binding protein CbpA
MPKDYYAILGVSHDADSATIHSAFRSLARQYHPDTGGGSSISKFRDALEAYHALGDPGRRRQHDLASGQSVQPERAMAEPLFDPARPRNRFVHPMPPGLDQLMEDLLRSVESEFGFAFFARGFFW